MPDSNEDRGNHKHVPKRPERLVSEMTESPETIDNYPYIVPLTTRWSDNDLYGHVNNVAFSSYFDTAANHYLIQRGGLDIENAAAIAVVVESKCVYHRPLQYPQDLRVGVRVDRLGDHSVTWGIGIFSEVQSEAAAEGYFVHVFVDRESRRPTEIPESLRAALKEIRAD